jgi:flagellar biosynthesis chaperone FliJ
LVDARREKRMYEILGERVAARKLEASSRRRQAEIDEMLQRVAKTS